MQKKVVIRIVIGVALFICAVLGLWWIMYPIGIFGAWRYQKFYELPLSALALDIIYSTVRERLFGFEYSYTIIAVVIFFIIIILKTKVRKEIWQKTF